MKYYKKIIPALAVSLCLTGCGNPVKKGVELMEAGQYEEALAKFESSIESGKSKKKAEAYRGQGIALWELKRYEEAEKAFEEALAAGAPKTGALYNLLAGCEMQTGAYQDALNHYNLGLSREGNTESLEQEMEFNTIAAYEKLYDWENAKEKLEAYIGKYPDDTEAAKEWEFLQSR